jgi:hypothetical protein
MIGSIVGYLSHHNAYHTETPLHAGWPTSREPVRAKGGELELEGTGLEGTPFRLTLVVARATGTRAQG